MILAYQDLSLFWLQREVWNNASVKCSLNKDKTSTYPKYLSTNMKSAKGMHSPFQILPPTYSRHINRGKELSKQKQKKKKDRKKSLNCCLKDLQSDRKLFRLAVVMCFRSICITSITFLLYCCENRFYKTAAQMP